MSLPVAINRKSDNHSRHGSYGSSPPSAHVFSGGSPINGTLLGSSPPSGLGSLKSLSGRDISWAAAKKFWKRICFDPTLNSAEFTIGFVESVQQQERKSGVEAWSLRLHDVTKDVQYNDFVKMFPDDDIPFHRIAYYKHRGSLVWESEYHKKRCTADGGQEVPGAGPAQRRTGSPMIPTGSSPPMNSFLRDAKDMFSSATKPRCSTGASSDTDESCQASHVRPAPRGQLAALLDGVVADALAGSPAREAGPEGEGGEQKSGQEEEEERERQLPEECWMAVLYSLGVREVCMMGRVNRWLRQLSICPTVWRQQYTQLFGEAPQPDYNPATVRRMCRRSELRAARWLEADVQEQQVGYAGTSCLQFDDSKVVSADGSAIRLWSHSTGRRIATLQGHTGRVSCVAFDEDQLVSGCSQNTVKVWGMDDLKCRRTLRGHDAAVTGVTIMNSIPISASADGHIKLWDISSGQQIVSFESPRAVHAMSVQEPTGYLVSAGWCVHMWDVSTAQLLHSLSVWSEEGPLDEELAATAADPHARSPFSCVAYSGSLLAAGRPGEAVLWDTRSQETVGVIRASAPKGPQSPGAAARCVGVQLDDWKLLTGFSDGSGSLQLHDMRALSSSRGKSAAWREPLLVLTAPGKINCFQFHKEELLAGLEGHECVLWSFVPPGPAGAAAVAPQPPAPVQGGSWEEAGGGDDKGNRKKKPAKLVKKQNRYPKRK